MLNWIRFARLTPYDFLFFFTHLEISNAFECGLPSCRLLLMHSTCGEGRKIRFFRPQIQLHELPLCTFVIINIYRHSVYSVFGPIYLSGSMPYTINFHFVFLISIRHTGSDPRRVHNAHSWLQNAPVRNFFVDIRNYFSASISHPRMHFWNFGQDSWHCLRVCFPSYRPKKKTRRKLSQLCRVCKMRVWRVDFFPARKE